MRDVDRNIAPLVLLLKARYNPRQSGDVVGVLMGDEDGIEARRIFADRFQALTGILHAEPAIDKQPRTFGCDER